MDCVNYLNSTEFTSKIALIGAILNGFFTDFAFGLYHPDNLSFLYSSVSFFDFDFDFFFDFDCFNFLWENFILSYYSFEI